jgi:hypothetical protein
MQGSAIPCGIFCIVVLAADSFGFASMSHAWEERGNVIPEEMCGTVWYVAVRRRELEGPHWKQGQRRQTPWPESASELYRPSDRRLSTKLVPTFADRGCHVVSVTDSYDRILGFLDRNRYFFLQVVPRLYSRGWVDLVPDPPLHRISGSAGNRTRTTRSVARNSDHRGGLLPST